MFDKLINTVEFILKQEPETRNSDDYLVYCVWCKVEDATKADGIHLNLTKLKALPSYDTISRIRRKFQEESMYLPTNPAVIRKRRIKEEQMREWARKTNLTERQVFSERLF
jgi:hypothetical protein